MGPGGLGLTPAIGGSGLLVARRQGKQGFDLGIRAAETDSGAGEAQALTELVHKQSGAEQGTDERRTRQAQVPPGKQADGDQKGGVPSKGKDRPRRPVSVLYSD